MTTETTTRTIRTIIHAYGYDMRKPDEATAYRELSERLRGMGLVLMDSISGNSDNWVEKIIEAVSGQEIELETKYLFDNQWNTAPLGSLSESGLRVFDWHEDIKVYNRSLKVGHWLEQTDEMREVRRNTLKCGYCGHQKQAGQFAFCPDCLDSQYLTEDQLLKGATRLVPVDQGHNWTPLTEAEQAELLPRYRDAQVHGSTERGKARLAKQRADIEAKFQKETANAKTERDGLIWLLDHGINIDNVIYYDHREMFSFGWRQPVSAAVRDRVLDVISEFPFEYEIKAEDKVYSGRE